MRHPYPRYRDSGVEWLGEIPGHWEVKRLKRSVIRSDVRVESEDADQMPYVGLEHVTSWTGTLAHLDDQQTPESLSNAFTSGNVLFGKLRPYLAKAFCADFDGLCSTEFLVLRPFGYQHQYLLYALLTSGFVSLVDSSTFGARMPRASWGFVSDSLLPVPPLEEQRAIAAFLNRETGKIDQLVDKKRLLIERLEEYRQALITRTITRGLPPDAARVAGLDPRPRLKPSGAEWLGEIPEHWELRRMNRIAHLKAGDGIPSDEIDDDGEFPVFGGNGIRGFTDRCTHEGEFVLVGRQGALCGNVHLVRGRFWASEHAVVVTPTDDGHAPWLSHVLTAMKLNQYSYAAAQPGLAIDRISTLLVPVPPLAEQRCIAEFLSEWMGRVDVLAARVKAAVERLEEYRAAQVTAAVTGKIDVRGDVPAKPERVGA